MSKKKSEVAKAGVVILNKNARREYEIVSTLEAGLVLKGNEVKSIRNGQVNIKESYVRVSNGQAFLLSCHISPYEFARSDECEPGREIKLLINKKEIDWLDDQLRKKGLSVVPLKIYFSKNLCKIELGVGRGKKLHDKRQDLKKRDASRDIQRALKN